VALYKLGWKEALVINVIRIVLVGFTFGNMFSLMYSLAGGLLSGAGMIVLKNVCRARLVSVSVVGALLHNLGQLIVAMIVLDSSSLFYYLVVLWIAGAVAGTFLGLICVPIVKSIKKIP
jgi:heptaprenyl diphosphate synthase